MDVESPIPVGFPYEPEYRSASSLVSFANGIATEFIAQRNPEDRNRIEFVINQPDAGLRAAVSLSEMQCAQLIARLTTAMSGE